MLKHQHPTIRIEPATAHDTALILRLVTALAVYEKLEHQVVATEDTLRETLAIFAEMMPGIGVRPERMLAAAREGYATATDLADYLVKKGLPFRDAHEVVALAVRHAESRKCDLSELPPAELRRFSPKIGADVARALTLEGSVAARNHPGGTAPARVRQAARRALRRA